MPGNPLAALINDVRRVAPIEFSPRLPPWSRLKRDQSAVSRLRLAATRLGALRGGSRIGRIKLLLVGFFWPLKATLDSVLAVMHYGPRVRVASGIGHVRQWWDAMKLAHAWNYSPKTYYTYRLWDPVVRRRATSFLQRHELTALQLSLNDGSERNTISDKAVFEARCAQAGIPTPKVVATLTRDSEQWADSQAALPHRDLFIKRVQGMQGIGSERWIFDSREGRWLRQSDALLEGELVAHLRSLASTHPIIVQHCLRNHPEIARLTTGGLSTFRIMTYLNDANRPTLLAMTLRLARNGADIDNMHAGGIACPVNPSTGELGPGLGLDPGEPAWQTHPDTNEPISGVRLTTHRQVIDLAMEAHRKLSVPWSVGWDVAMTSQGAVLIEGNAVWGAAVYHAPHRAGLTDEFARGLLKRISAMAGLGSRPVADGYRPHDTVSLPG